MRMNLRVYKNNTCKKKHQPFQIKPNNIDLKYFSFIDNEKNDNSNKPFGDRKV